MPHRADRGGMAGARLDFPARIDGRGAGLAMRDFISQEARRSVERLASVPEAKPAPSAEPAGNELGVALVAGDLVEFLSDIHRRADRGGADWIGRELGRDFRRLVCRLA